MEVTGKENIQNEAEAMKKAQELARENEEKRRRKLYLNSKDHSSYYCRLQYSNKLLITNVNTSELLNLTKYMIINSHFSIIIAYICS